MPGVGRDHEGVCVVTLGVHEGLSHGHVHPFRAVVAVDIDAEVRVEPVLVLENLGVQVRSARPLLGVVSGVEWQEDPRVRRVEAHVAAILVQGAGGVAGDHSVVEVDACGREELPNGQGGVERQVQGLVESQDVEGPFKADVQEPSNRVVQQICIND